MIEPQPSHAGASDCAAAAARSSALTVIELTWAEDDSTVIRDEPSRASCNEICVDERFTVLLIRLVPCVGCSPVFAGAESMERMRFVGSIVPRFVSFVLVAGFDVDHVMSSLTGAAVGEAD